MSWQVYLQRGAALVSVCIIAAVLSGLVLICAWTIWPDMAVILSVALFVVGLVKRWKTSIGRALSIGVFFGLVLSTVGAAVRSPTVSAILGTMYGPADRTDAEAKVYFDQHRPIFDALVHLISQCEGLGRLSIYPDGHRFSVSDRVTCPSITEISMHLKAAKILWVIADSISPYGEQGPFSAMFVLSSRGIVGHGSGSAIYYGPELETNPFGDSYPLEGVPGHWFYRHL